MTWVVRGVLVGAVAGVITGVLALGIAEPSLDRAIALEEIRASQAGGAEGGGPPAGSGRALQKGGLPLATGLWGAALGLLIALVYSAVRPRMRVRGDGTAALLLTGALFLAVVAVPFLKYAPDPPGVADPDTVGRRTALWITMVAVTLLAVILSSRLSLTLAPRLAGAGTLARPLAWVAVFGATIVAASALMPAAEGVPDDYPADLLWDFRLSSLAVQGLLWGLLAVGFGVLAERRSAAARW